MGKVRFLFAAGFLATILFWFSVSSKSTNPVSVTESFTFVSMGDGQANTALFTTTLNQVASLNPDFFIFNGDLELNGVVSTEIDPMVTAIKNAGLFNQAFLVRGNHDNVTGGSAGLWESYFETPPNVKVLPAGVTEYVSLDSNSDYLNYSFIFGNAMFIGLDVPGDIWSVLTPAELTFLDARLTYAESIGLVHAFIYFHGPLYCVEAMHCSCTSRTDASCTPPALVTVINNHPIVSATFHGHEHILGWTHMDSSRVAGLTGSFEEFLTSPSGGTTYNGLLFPARMDYTYMDMGASQGFAAITVDGCSFTFNIYKVGTTGAVWSRSFTKGNCSTPTATYTPSLTNTATPACFALAMSHSGNGSTPVADPLKSDACLINGKYISGQVISLSGAVPDSGWQVASWTGTSNDTSMVGTNTLTMPASNTSVAVNYGKVTIGSWIPIFQGIDQADAQTTIISGSGNQVIHALRIDLQNPDIHLFTTPPMANNYQPELRETAGLTTSEFLLNYNLQAAINANFFSPCCSQSSGDPFEVYGLAISEGKLVSTQEDATYAASMVFTSDNTPSMIPMNWPAVNTSGIFTAVSGKYPLVVHGVNVASNGAIHPRTAIGYSQDGRYLILMTIDGRQPGYSDGAVDWNTAEWMLRLGTYEAVNLDGGGSTTMVISDGLGGAQVLNRPIHNNIPGMQRVVANQMGIYANPLVTPTATSSNTPTKTRTATATFTPSSTPTHTPTPSSTSTATFTPSNTPTYTLTPSSTPTATFTPTKTHTATATFTPSNTPTYTPTPSSTLTATFTPTRTNTATATFTPVTHHSIPLVPGWNLVSFNVHPSSTAIAEELASLGGNYNLVYAWDATGAHSVSGNWMRYAPGIPGNTLLTLDETQGFWIRMTSAATLDIVGTAPSITNISLLTTANGWNLVGYPSNQNRILPDALTLNGVTGFNLVYANHANDTGDPWKRYAPGVPGNDLPELSPGWGYWIKLSAVNTWNVGY